MWGGVLAYLGVMAGTAALAWHLPDQYQSRFVASFLVIGMFFDVVSVICYVDRLITRRRVSAFPFVGMVFYLWGWLCLSHAIILPATDATGLVGRWVRKLVDLPSLAAFHLLFHAPFWLVGWVFRPNRRG